MKKKLNLLLVVVLITTLFVGCNQGDNNVNEVETVVWKVAYEEIEGGIQDLYAKKFEELIEAKFEGRVDVELYPAGQLGYGSAQTELLKAGGVEFMLNYAAVVATTIPETQVLSLNFLYSEDHEVNMKVLNQGKGIKRLDELFLENDMKSLHWFNLGFMNWTSNRPLNSIEDFEGFKMRTMASPIIIANYKALNANPTPVPFMEVYSSLQLKMIDGQENPVATIQEMKFHEVQDYLTLSKHGILPCNLVSNVNFWDKMSDEDKALFESILPELSDYIVVAQAELTEKRLQLIKDSSEIEVTELTAEQRAAFTQASLSVRDEYINEVGDSGKEILDLFIQDLKNFE